jgi:DNA polymerase-3 subunit epsilon
MRQVFMDIRTSGLLPEQGARLIELACIEAEDGRLTGRCFHRHLDPGYELPEDVLRRLGYDADMLPAKRPHFADIAAELVSFLSGAELVLHHYSFHHRFLKTELQRCGLKVRLWEQPVTDISDFIEPPAERHLPLEQLACLYGLPDWRDLVHLSGALRGAHLLARLHGHLTGHLVRPAPPGEAFTDREFTALWAFGEQLRRLEFRIVDEAKRIERPLAARLADPGDRLEDYEIEAEITYYLREGDPAGVPTGIACSRSAAIT